MQHQAATTLVVIRHAESSHTLRDEVAGIAGCRGLTPVGRRQARALADRLWRLYGPPDSISSSPVARALETASIVRSTLDLELPLSTDVRLTEPSPGIGDGLSREEFTARFGSFDMQSEPDRVLAPEGESWNMFLHRISAYIDSIHPRDRRLEWVFTHAGVMVWMMKTLFGDKGPGRIEFENCSFMTFEIQRPHWVLQSYYPGFDHHQKALGCP